MKNSMKNLKLKLRLSALTVAMIWTCGASSQGTESASNQFKESNGAYALVPVLSDLPSSWALAHSPNGDIWISHREGGLSIFNQGEDVEHPSTQALNTIDFVPEDLLTGGQGGLLDIAFHPNYADNAWVYLSYSAGSSDKNALKIVRFNKSVNKIQDLSPNMVLEGVITNVTHFGAFIDLGVHQDALIHVSQLSNEYVNDPSEVVSPGDILKVKVLEVDVERKRIAATRKF